MSPQDLHGSTVYSSDGEKLGTVDDVHIDDDGNARFVSLKSGLFGMKKRNIPAAGLESNKDGLQSMYTKDQIENGPAYDDDHIDEDRHRELGGYYGQDAADHDHDDGRERRASGGDSVTRSEEELRIGSHREESGHVRLRKWVETEDVSETVQVEHERARIEREPIHGSEGASSSIGEEEIEVTLQEEVVDAEKATVGKERIRIEKDVETEEQVVEAELRKERVEVDEDDGRSS